MKRGKSREERERAMCDGGEQKREQQMQSASEALLLLRCTPHLARLCCLQQRICPAAWVGGWVGCRRGGVGGGTLASFPTRAPHYLSLPLPPPTPHRSLDVAVGAHHVEDEHAELARLRRGSASPL
jgi:hypothetical protein